MSEKFDIYSKIVYRDVEKFVRYLCVYAGVELLRQLFLQCISLLATHLPYLATYL
jgi:hypothetical protein